MEADELRRLAHDRELLEVGRKAVEDALIECRDVRLSVPFRNNGLVVKEQDGSPSDTIRMGPEEAMAIGLRAIADHLADIDNLTQRYRPTTTQELILGYDADQITPLITSEWLEHAQVWEVLVRPSADEPWTRLEGFDRAPLMKRAREIAYPNLT